MRTAGIHRSQVVRVLLGCILFSLFACGLHHGQMSSQGLAVAARQVGPGVVKAGPQADPHAGLHSGLHTGPQTGPHHGVQAGHVAHSHAQHASHATPLASAPTTAPSGHGGHDDHQLTPAFSCPLCSSFGGVLAVNSRAWTLPVAPWSAPLRARADAGQGSPRRERWSALNPRAPPFDLSRS